MKLAAVAAGRDKFELRHFGFGRNAPPRRIVAELTVLYDGACNLCRGSAARVRLMDPAGRIELLDLHDPTVPPRFPQVNLDEAMRLMQAVDPRGRVYSGADAWARIGLALPGWKLISWLLLVPGIHFAAQHFYAWLARNRYRWNRELCEDGTCALHVDRPPAPNEKRRQ
jgi:predicted DCC family thiol-disulfide oxidoreductase YuxK